LLAHHTTNKNQSWFISGYVYTVSLVDGYAEEDSDGSICFGHFSIADVLVDVRTQTVKANVLSSSSSELQVQLQQLAAAEDTESTGKLTPAQLRVVLQKAPQMTLSRVQTLSVIAAAEPEDDGRFDIPTWSAAASVMIEAMFDAKTVQRRAALMARSELQTSVLMQGQGEDELERQLMTLFQKHDVDGNNRLDPEEFKAAMQNAEMDLDSGEIAALMVAADEDGDGMVDYREFVDLVYGTLAAIKREKAVARLLYASDESI
jgi:hypothetical protein